VSKCDPRFSQALRMGCKDGEISVSGNVILEWFCDMNKEDLSDIVARVDIGRGCVRG
jgi:hypothetical protein